MGLFLLVKQRFLGPVAAWVDRGISLHYVANQALRREVAVVAPRCRGVLLDVGCGGQPYRDLFGQISFYVGMDMQRVQGAILCGDAQRLPFADEGVDAVLCNQVLEHVPEPALLMREVARVLKPGGHLVLTTPQTWGLHLEPHDYYRYTKYGLAHLARQAGFEVLSIVPTTGLAATMAQRFADTVFVARFRSARLVYRATGKLLLFPFLWVGNAVDGWLKHAGDTLDNVMLARKPDHAG